MQQYEVGSDHIANREDIKGNHFFFFIMFFLLCSSQNLTCRGPAVSLNTRPQWGHFTPASFWACFSIAAYLGSKGSFLFSFRPALRARESAFHLGIFWFFSCYLNFCSTCSPFFMSFFCWLSTILCSWVLNSFLFFWKTCLQLASCLPILSGLNLRPQTRHGLNSDGSYSTMSILFSRLTSLILLYSLSL